MMRSPLRGEIWITDFDPAQGHEQAGIRPALVISVDPFNTSTAKLAVVLPLTSRDKHIRTQVPVQSPEGGLMQLSFIKCEDVRSLSISRLIKRLGVVREDTLEAVEMRLRLLLGL